MVGLAFAPEETEFLLEGAHSSNPALFELFLMFFLPLWDVALKKMPSTTTGTELRLRVPTKELVIIQCSTRVA